MNNLKVFENPNLGKVRVVERNGEPWFVAVDVCRVLGLDDTGKAVSRLDDDELTRIKIGSGGQMREAYAVNESGLYALVLGSRKPEAKAFKRWVTHEVLPAIRRTGRYQADGVQPITPAMALEAAQLLQGVSAGGPALHPQAAYRRGLHPAPAGAAGGAAWRSHPAGAQGQVWPLV